MTKQELKNDIMDAKLLIKKVPGNDEFHTEIVAEGTFGALACILGKAIIDIANTSKEGQIVVEVICRSIIDQLDEQKQESEDAE